MNGSGNFTINGTVNVPFTFTGLANNTATLVANLTNGNYTRGSNISCSAYVNDGTANSSINTSANITIVPNYAPVFTLLNPSISSVIFNASTFVQKNVSATNQSASAYLLQANYVGNRSSINMTCSMSPSISGITVYVAQSFNVSASLPCNGSTVATAANNTNLTWWAWASFYFPSNRSAAINISFGGG